LTPDPIKLAGGLNSYQYVPNPTGWVDPLGLNGCPGQTKFTRKDKFYGSRRAAFQDAKRDARIPTSAEPMEVNHVALTKIGEHGVGKQMFSMQMAILFIQGNIIIKILTMSAW
jgi:uncharacterized protein RhaS with RHS repeats